MARQTAAEIDREGGDGLRDCVGLVHGQEGADRPLGGGVIAITPLRKASCYSLASLTRQPSVRISPRAPRTVERRGYPPGTDQEAQVIRHTLVGLARGSLRQASRAPQ